MLNTNAHLGSGKRKAKHPELNFGTFKRIKLDNAGSNNRFRTVKDPLKDDSTWVDLVKNFTDFSKGAELYSKMISQDISPHWVNEPDVVTHTTVLSKTWDKDFNCTTCVPTQPVINR